jgi:hypothetical protein
MSDKSIQAVLIVGACAIALVFVKLMFDMSRSMGEMTAYISTISQDVSHMQQDMRALNESMLRMEKSLHGIGQAFSQGSEQFRQMSPGGMMQQVFPDGGQRKR